MSKHTPGPWNIGMSANEIMHDDCKGGDFVAIDGNGHGAFAVVVWRMDGDEKSPVCEANARLIAAAPDMLESLKKMLDEHYYQIGYDMTIDNPACVAAVAAIAKATGETK